jgi:hypothetical protein
VAARYLLPCPCGRKVPVEPSQAGEAVRCDCGASLETPTLLGMTVLERADLEASPQRVSGPWGVRQTLAVVGAVILIGAVGLTVFLLTAAPSPPEFNRIPLTPQEIRQWAASLTPLTARRSWQFFRVSGPDGRTPIEEPIYDKKVARYRDRLLQWHLSIGVAVVVGLVGLGLIVVPLSLKPGGKAAEGGR